MFNSQLIINPALAFLNTLIMPYLKIYYKYTITKSVCNFRECDIDNLID